MATLTKKSSVLVVRSADCLAWEGKAAPISGLYGNRGLGGLKETFEGLKGRDPGENAGLQGLGTRGNGVGGNGTSMVSVGIDDLDTHGRGGRGTGSDDYGEGAASLGKKKDRDVQITAGQAVVHGSLSKDLIRKVILDHRAQIRFCYEKELQRYPDLHGKVSTAFVINAQGLVRKSEVVHSTLGNREVERCIAAKIRTWKFPEPKGGGIVEVKYPFIFKTSG